MASAAVSALLSGEVLRQALSQSALGDACSHPVEAELLADPLAPRRLTVGLMLDVDRIEVFLRQ